MVDNHIILWALYKTQFANNDDRKCGGKEMICVEHCVGKEKVNSLQKFAIEGNSVFCQL